VHVACGRHIADRLPPDAVVATTDLGAIAYFARRPILHLGGLVDPETTRALRAGRCVPHIRRRGATHLAVAQHGRADAEPLERLGLLPPAPDRPALAFLDMWVVFPGHYRLHQGATSTATPAIALYRLDRP